MTNTDLIKLTNDALTARIDRMGSELLSLTDASGRELMTDADPRWWTGHAPFLFPFVGRLAGDHYRYDGLRYPMPQHGFARRCPFVLIEQGDADARLRLDPDAASREIYPFEFRLEISFRLDGSTLAIAAQIHNRGDADMPFSFGYHPAFAWPLPFGAESEAHRILFDEPENRPIRRIEGTGLIAPVAEPSPVSGRLLAPDPAMFERDALIWDKPNSHGLVWGAPGTPGLRIDFPDTPMLALWQKPGAHYLCIEPWAGLADPAGFENDVWAKPGIIRLPPAQMRRFRLGISLLPSFPAFA